MKWNFAVPIYCKRKLAGRLRGTPGRLLDMLLMCMELPTEQSSLVSPSRKLYVKPWFAEALRSCVLLATIYGEAQAAPSWILPTGTSNGITIPIQECNQRFQAMLDLVLSEHGGSRLKTRYTANSTSIVYKHINLLTIGSYGPSDTQQTATNTDT